MLATLVAGTVAMAQDGAAKDPAKDASGADKAKQETPAAKKRTPEQRVAGLKKRVEELRKKKDGGTITEKEQQQLDKLEAALKKAEANKGGDAQAPARKKKKKQTN